MKIFVSLILLLLTITPVFAQDFDFEKINKDASNYIVSVEILIEVSFGLQTTEAKSRGIGAIVSSDGLVIFDGTPVDSDDPFSAMAGMSVSTEPTGIEVVKMDGTRYTAEFIGVDRFTKIGFCRITSDEAKKFDYLKFKQRNDFKIGEWIAVHLLLPEFVTPHLGADIGLVSAIIKEPDEFVLTVGFNELEIGSVMYDQFGTAIGVLGNLNNPAMTGFDAAQMMESFSQIDDYIPLLGVIDADHINRLIKDPPRKGEVNRGWLGIYLQALTPDIAEFWGIESIGGIIVNDVVKDSPADSAGIETGDIIVQLGGIPIEVDKEETLPVFQKQISEMGAGSEVDFTILRRLNSHIDTIDVEIILAQAPLSPIEAEDYEDDNFEMKIREMVFADYNIYNLDRGKFEGVVVKEVEPGGWSAVGGIMPGDIIQSIGERKTPSVEETKEILTELGEKKPEEVIFFIWRDKKTLFINIKTDW